VSRGGIGDVDRQRVAVGRARAGGAIAFGRVFGFLEQKDGGGHVILFGRANNGPVVAGGGVAKLVDRGDIDFQRLTHDGFFAYGHAQRCRQVGARSEERRVGNGGR